MTQTLPFPLYHGSSSYYVALFKRGLPSTEWPFRAAAINFVRESAAVLIELGLQLEWWEERVLLQTDHWQHGQMYVSPSKFTAAKYAYSSAAYGGELVNIGIEMLQRIRDRSATRAGLLLTKYSDPLPMLAGLGRPIVLEISDLSAALLVPEREGRNSEEIDNLISIWQEGDLIIFDALAQQCNFRLPPGAGLVTGIFEVIGESEKGEFEYRRATWDDFS